MEAAGLVMGCVLRAKRVVELQGTIALASRSNANRIVVVFHLQVVVGVGGGGCSTHMRMRVDRSVERP